MNAIEVIIKIKTPPYDPSRYSAPFCGTIEFSVDAGGAISPGEWLGNATPGSEGLLIINATPGTIVIEGQTDYREINTYTRYCEIASDGSPVWLGVSKMAAFHAWERIQSEGPLPALTITRSPNQEETSVIDPWNLEDQAPPPYEIPESEAESPETNGLWRSTINASIAAGRRPLIPISNPHDNRSLSDPLKLTVTYKIP